MRSPFPGLLAATLMTASVTAFSFETPTHYDISLAAAESALTDHRMLNLGRDTLAFSDVLVASNELDYERDFAKVSPICRHSGPFTPDLLIACGAMFEDYYWDTRPIFHFLDPQHLEGSGLGSPLLQFSAADWALKDNSNRMPSAGVFQPQHYSYRDAEDYLFDALTFGNPAYIAESETIRRKAWGAMFQSLGQVIHLIQDMASPQHTRNEPHYDKLDLGRLSQKSRYEQRALESKVADWIRLCLITHDGNNTQCEYNSAAPAVPIYPAFARYFQTPRAFWESAAGTGLAQITSTSFPSNLNNFRKDISGNFLPAQNYPMPAPLDAKDIRVGEMTHGMPQEIPGFMKTVCGSDLMGCRMKMIGANVADPLTGNFVNDRASTDSLFDQDLEDYNRYVVGYDALTGAVIGGDTYARFNINRFNIDRAYSILIPRALAYSAGFLNFYFRGEMKIEPPSNGVYAIVDHSGFSTANPTDVDRGYRGFRTIRLSLANITPQFGGPAQAMTNGRLWAILRFRRNKCYSDDLGQSNTTQLDNCISDTNEIVVSDPIDRTGPGVVAVQPPTDEHPNGEELTFNLRAELPINAWNVLLQVVFRGTLGVEENKIAVSTVDISEPTFFSIFNNTDRVYMGGNCYTPEQVKADSNLWKRVSNACLNPAHPTDILNDSCYNAKYGLHVQDAASDPPTLVVSNEVSDSSDNRIPPRRFSRFAVLTASSGDIDLSFHFWNPTLIVAADDKNVQVNPFHAHRSRVTPGASTLDTMKPFRGVNVWNGLAFMVDAEKGILAEDDGSGCIAGADGSLPALVDAERYPVASQITYTTQ